MTKLGRPRKRAAERLDDVLRVRITTKDKKLLAKAAGGNSSQWARDVLLRAAARRLK